MVNTDLNQRIQPIEEWGLIANFLHSYEIKFPEVEGYFSYLSGKSFKADLPERLKKVASKLGFNV